jgi:outer membrane protein OmpA-like peptidoglycan-associated protein
MPLDPKLLNTLLSTFNPNTYIRWGMAGLDPRAWNLAATVANPALYTSMMGAVVNPYGYGQGTSNWLTWKPVAPIQGANNFSMWDPLAMLGNLSGFIPGINLSGLPELPNIGLPTITLPIPVPPPSSGATYELPKPVAKVAESAKPALAPAAPVVKAVAPEAKPVAPAVPVVAAKPVEAAKPVVVAPAPVAKVEAAPAAAAAGEKLVLAGDALFLSGKSGIRNLSKEGKQRLDEVVAKIKAMASVEQVKVVGHADPTGNARVNQQLSEARAKSIKSYLIAKGIKPAVIITSGLGDTQPVVQCDAKLPSEELKACHAPNRRVEIEIAGKAK